jgi:hypothetical protein
VRFLVWNAQGATSSQGGENALKWEALWSNGIQPIVGIHSNGGAGQADNVMALLCESGWAPWLAANLEVTINTVYPLNRDSKTYNATAAQVSPFCMAVNQTRTWTAWWMPWLKTIDSMRQSVRCSFGMFYAPHPAPTQSWSLTAGVDRFRDDAFVRPVLRVQVGRLGFGMTVLMVHLVSSANAPNELADLLRAINQFVTSGPIFLVGDMNIDLRNNAPGLPTGWQYVRTGLQTQVSGGELDWGLLRGDFTTTRATVLQTYKTGWNLSDHSVIAYDIA